jgi:hypothetical protein
MNQECIDQTRNLKPRPLFPGGRLIPAANLNQTIRWWLYVYLFLLVFEGAIRKWLFSGMPLMANAFLIVRDPVVIIIYFLAWREQLWIPSALLTAFLCVAFGIVVLGVVQMLELHDVNPLVIVYGIRVYVLHLPLAFLMPRIIGRNDLLRIGRWSLFLAPFMAALMCIQFALPSDHFLNAAVGGGEQIGSTLGHIRPAATFSFSTGAGSFFLLVGAFWFYSFVDSSWLPASARWWSAIAIVLTLPISGSRGYVVSFAVFMLFACIGGYFNSRLWTIAIRTALGLALAALILFQFGLFRDGIDVFLTRWDEGAQGDVHNAIVGRFFGGLTGAFANVETIPWLGYGLGLGSNVGSKLMTGSLEFLLAENEWERSMLEMGLFIGVVWLAYRVVLTGWVGFSCMKRLAIGDSLGWLLMGASIITLLDGNMVQPASQGFIVVALGFCLVAVGYGLPQRGSGMSPIPPPPGFRGIGPHRGFPRFRRPPVR